MHLIAFFVIRCWLQYFLISPLFLHKNKIFTLFCVFIRFILHYFVDLLYNN